MRMLVPIACLLLAACQPPSPPEEERPPVPKSAAAESPITRYADSYKDRARAVEAQQQAAADRQRAQIDAAEP